MPCGFEASLARAIDWSIADLDLFYRALNPSWPAYHELDLAELARVKFLREKYNLDLAELLSWFGDLETDKRIEAGGRRISQFESIFSDRTVVRPGQKDDFEYDDGGLVGSGDILQEDRVSRVSSATGLSRDE